MRRFVSILLCLVFIKPAPSQNLNLDNEELNSIKEGLEYGLFERGDDDNPYICDINGNIVQVPFKNICTRVQDYKDGYIIVASRSYLSHGLYDLHTKQFLIPLDRDRAICELRQGKYIVNEEHQAYVFDAKSKSKINTGYTWICPYKDEEDKSYPGYISVRDGEKIGIMNEDLELLVPCDYDHIAFRSYIDSGPNCFLIIATKRGSHIDCYHTCDKKIVYRSADKEKVHEYVGMINGKLCFLTGNGEYGKVDKEVVYWNTNQYFGVVIDENGHRLTTEKYVYIQQIDDNTYFASQGKHKGGLLNSKLQKKTPFIYDENYARAKYDAGLYTMEKDGKMGALNAKGDVVIPFIYEQLCFYDHETLGVTLNGKKGVIDRKGHTIIPCNYDHIELLKGSNLFAVKQSRREGLINRKGEIVVPFVYNSLDDPNFWSCGDMLRGLGFIISASNENGKWRYGLLDQNGNELIAPSLSKKDIDFYVCQYCYNQSDVDNNIPTTSRRQRNTFALIIANENYSGENISKVDFALRDGTVFKEYCQKTLGIPEQNTIYIPNGTLNQIYIGLNKLKDLVSCVSNSKVIVYYTGHGIPDEHNVDSYLLPVDGMANDNRTAISLSDFYNEIGSMRAKQVVVFLDACFSGLQRDGRLLVSNTRGVAIKQKAMAPKNNTIVFSASKWDEPALSYKKGKHGLFTYFLLKRLQESSGDVSLGELSQYLFQMVKKESILNANKTQTPTVDVSINMENNWKALRLNNNE